LDLDRIVSGELCSTLSPERITSRETANWRRI
jgi:hypothetical protein